MDGNIYANEAFKPVKKLTTTLIYFFIKTADGKLLMNVEAMEDLLYQQTGGGGWEGGRNSWVGLQKGEKIPKGFGESWRLQELGSEEVWWSQKSCWDGGIGALREGRQSRARRHQRNEGFRGQGAQKGSGGAEIRAQAALPWNQHCQAEMGRDTGNRATARVPKATAGVPRATAGVPKAMSRMKRSPKPPQRTERCHQNHSKDRVLSPKPPQEQGDVPKAISQDREVSQSHLMG